MAHDLAAVQPWSDLTFIAAGSAEDCLHKVLALCTEFIPRHHPWLHPVADVQVLAPMHKGVAGVANLNRELQDALNPADGPSAADAGPRARTPFPPRQRATLRTVAGEFRPGDKVIQLRNNYDQDLFQR